MGDNKIEDKVPLVLIVDDVVKNLQVLGNILGKEKYRVAAANNGEKAIIIADSSPPDLILLDIMMPGINGYETCKRLKENPKTKDIPIIFLSGLVVSEQEIEKHAQKGRYYMSKPCRIERLIKAIDKCVGAKSGGGGNMGFLAKFFKDLMLEANEDQD